MQLAIEVLNKTFLYHLFVIISVIIVVIICILGVIKSKDGGDRLAISTIAIVIVLGFYFFMVALPFLSDYCGEEIIVVEGIYQNSGVTNGKSSASGIYPVTITNDGEVLDLTTAPWNKSVFLIGEYRVIAYYVPNSNTLLHIEILEDTAAN